MPAVRPASASRRAMLSCSREQLSSVLPIADQNFAKFDMSFYSTRPDGCSGISPRENMEYNLGECKAYAAKFSKDSPICCCSAQPVWARPFSLPALPRRSLHADFPWPTTPPSTLWPRMGPSNSAPVTAKPPAERAARYERADLLIIDDMGTEMEYCLYGFRAVQPDQQPPDG